MKIQTKRNISNIVCFLSVIAMLFITVIFSLHPAGVEGRPELFINDKPWYNSAKYPIEVIDGVVYVPATAFAELSNIMMNASRDLDVFYIDNTVTGKFISFDRNNEYAFLNNEELVKNIKTYLYGDVIYIPLNFVSSAIGVSVSQYKSTATNTTYYRIYNGTQKLSFEELLKLYKPSALNPSDNTTDTTTPKVTDTTAPDSSDESSKEPIDPIFVYLTFDGIPKSDSGIYAILKENGIPAAFFVSKDDMKSDIPGLIRIYNEGYSIILKDDDSSDVSDFSGYITYLNDTNRLLSQILKIKSHLVSSSSAFGFTASDMYSLSKSGYVMWNANIDYSDSASGGATIFKNIKNDLQNIPNPVISLGTNTKAEDALRRLLEYFNETEYFIPSEISLYITEINTLS